MAITTIINYDVNGNQDITLELTDYNDANNTITDLNILTHGMVWVTGSPSIRWLSKNRVPLM